MLAAGLLGGACLALLPRETTYIVLPTLASMMVFIIFTVILKARVGDYLFGEIGFLYMALTLAYTIFPAYTFIALDLDLASGWVWQNLSQLLPAPDQLGLHLWRHALFLFGVGTAYLTLRGNAVPQTYADRGPQGKDHASILFLAAALLVCIVLITLLSAPVTTYIENYTRFDHLSWGLRKFVSVCSRLKQGLFVALIALLFTNFERYRWTSLIVVAVMCAYEMVTSFGSRIESLVVMLMALCLFHLCVNRITLKRGLIIGLAIGMLFSVVEIFRSYEFDLNETRSAVSSTGLGPASEFGAVFFTGFHLYAERSQGTMPSTEWPMFFNDFISLVAPNDFVRWHPQYWYARAYYPDDVVPPQTMSPIADSAIWGGEIDLFIRSLINGAFFAYIVRWFIGRRDKWWGVAIYVFCYATCVMTLKYSIFWHLNPLFKTYLPMALSVEALRRLLPSATETPAGV